MATKLCKLTLLVAFDGEDPTGTDGGLEALGDQLADIVRSQGALTVCSEYESAEQELADPDDTEALIHALTVRWEALVAQALPPATVTRRAKRPACGATTTDSHRTSTCRLPQGHKGWHTDTKHPLHPSWP